MKTRYVIYFSGLFEFGHVTLIYCGPSRDIKFSTIEESMQIATKFRFRFLAKMCCWFLNKSSERDWTLRTFEVKIILLP